MPGAHPGTRHTGAVCPVVKCLAPQGHSQRKADCMGNVLSNYGVLGITYILGINLDSSSIKGNAFRWAVVMLSVYHGAFICEALRSGVNAAPAGQAEAARSIGLTFGQSMRYVLLPQAYRGAVAPIGSTIIALI